MKIAFVRARYSAQGGAERFAARAVAALAQAAGEALDVAMLARRWDERAAGVAKMPLRVVRLDPFYLGSTWRDASFARAVREHVARERYDLVQSHERIAGLPIYRAGDGVHAAWLERRARVLSPSARLGVALNPHHRWLVRTERRMFEHPSLRAVICNSNLVRDEIAARFAIDPAKLVLIRNAVDATHFEREPFLERAAAVRADLGLAAGAPLFVMVGSGFERKGVALALAALRDVPDAQLLIVGDDKHLASYREGARDLATRVRFVGAVDDTRPYLAAADAFVLPTLYDPFPNAALEAWAMGLPVITSTASGAAELIDEGENGWIVDPYDRGPLVTAMRDACSRDATRRAAMSIAARNTALPWSPVRLADDLLALYRGLLDSRPVGGRC